MRKNKTKQNEKTPLNITRADFLSDCPVCGASWKGCSFIYIYKSYLEANKTPYTEEELHKAVAEKHTIPNQSRIVQLTTEKGETTDKFVCPDCNTHFQMIEKENCHETK